MQNSILGQLAGALLKRSPLVQAVQQKSLAPYRKSMNNFAPQNIVPMGRIGKLSNKAAQKLFSPASLAEARRAFDADNLAWKVRQRAEAAAYKAKQYYQNKIWQPGRSEELISNYINKKR